MLHFHRVAAVIGVLLLRRGSAIDVDFTSPDSIKSAASTVAFDMISYYKGNESGQVPGLLPGPYYWWEAGAMFGAMINYWHTTGDTTYNDITMQALQFQVGPNKDYMPPNETASLGNDDQAFWAIAALAAAEFNFPNPPKPSDPSWLALAQAVFNEQISRWDTKYCGGGIPWQIPYYNAGYDLKNSISNGCLFQIAARLARYTNDEMYAQWAEKIWDWFLYVGLMDSDYNVFDNSEWAQHNCSQVDRNQWIYNAGTMLMGSAYMYNYTGGSSVWQNRTAGLLDTMAYDYFPSGIMKDICEEYNKCNVDQRSFKAYASRWLAATTQVAPFTYDKIMPLLLSSATAAAAQCNGPPTTRSCGQFWWKNGTFDGGDGVGQQMSALEVLLATLVPKTTPPVTNLTGGTSQGNKNAGNGSAVPAGIYVLPATKGDRAGAWLLTLFLLFAVLWTIYFMWSEVWERRDGGAVGRRRKGRGSPTWSGKGKGSPTWSGKGRGSPTWSEKGKGVADSSDSPTPRGDSELQLPPPNGGAGRQSNRSSRVKSVSFGNGVGNGDLPRPASILRRSEVVN